jgi:ATP phosphoribosyltransferase regulatory subunit
MSGAGGTNPAGSTAPWLLPEGVEEALPGEAEALERLRRTLLDQMQRWGYEPVIPPLIEYLDSLLTGAGSDLELDTFKLVDQLSGRMMGLRADMTPQVARIDAHRLGGNAPARLCYAGTVVHTRPGPFAGGRSPLQLGAELFGHVGLAADREVIDLMLAVLDTAGLDADRALDLGHVGVFRELAAASALSAHDEAALFEMCQRKSVPDISAHLDVLGLAEPFDGMWRTLPALHGGIEVLAHAREALAPAGERVVEAIDHLERLGRSLAARHGDALKLHFDLAELRGYRYHTGIVFAAYTPGEGEEIARGGRYDGIGAAFGRERPATGFSSDVRRLVRLGQAGRAASAWPGAIAAPPSDDGQLAARVAELRAAGECVIAMLPGQEATAADLGCDRELVAADGDWVLQEIGS